MSTHDARCPYTIQHLYTTTRSRTYVIRERDEFGEYPNIYAKVQLGGPGQQADVIILSDSGTGLDVLNKTGTIPLELGLTAEDVVVHRTKGPDRWNIATFLELTLNSKHALPYIVITTHCHYDHICGIQHLLDARTDVTVLSSSNDPGFLTPWHNLQKHSLCDLLGLKAPRYDGQLVGDAQKISYVPKGSSERRESSITAIHTPGHTPDSMSWYDHETYTLCVGDMFYERESDETRSGSSGHWSREPPQPVIFTKDSKIVDWNASMHRLLDFVKSENRKLGTDTGQSQHSKPTGYRQDGQGIPVEFTERDLRKEDWSLITGVPSRRRVALCAGHVTIATDAEFALLNMLAFMLRIQLDQVPKKKANDKEGNDDVWLWDDFQSSCTVSHPDTKDAAEFHFSVRAPWSIIHRASSMSTSNQAPPLPKSRNAEYRSMIQRITSSTQPSDAPSSLKANALASVSHSSVMADRPAVKAASIAKKG